MIPRILRTLLLTLALTLVLGGCVAGAIFPVPAASSPSRSDPPPERS